MRSRKRNSGKNRGTGAVTVTPPAPALDVTTEVAQGIEARDKLEAALARFDVLREQAKQKFLRNLAAELQTGEASAERLLEKATVWKNEGMRADEQKAALQLFYVLLASRIEEYKNSARAETVTALQRVITRLREDYAKLGADQWVIQGVIQARLVKLEAEITALQPSLPPAPPRRAKAMAPVKQAVGKAVK